ncbi:hypothetical protein ACFVAV_33390 [Nocardia sp. NPDC057663]|uniref:hypothetical protein n=1 Tax=Nocardia sp. NPDC057663 TaxID=3346201 RepID=UPI00366DB99F
MSSARGGVPRPPEGGEFEIAYVDVDPGEQRVALAGAWGVLFETCLPVRGFPSYKGQRNLVGRWWSAIG